MESKKTKLAILDRTIPLRAIPEVDLNRIILNDFLPWVCNILSLTGETSTDRLEIALPAIKEHCIGMGFAEIKKMFEMYADNKLHIAPIPNYFDRILLGKIVANYISQKNQTKKRVIMETQISEAEKEFIMTEAVDRIRKEYNQHKKITSFCTHVYDYLFKKHLLPTHTDEFRSMVHEKAVLELENYYEGSRSEPSVKTILEEIQKGTSDKITPIAKKIVLEEYFKSKP